MKHRPGSLIIFFLLCFLLLPLRGDEPQSITLEQAKKLAKENSRELQMLAYQLKGAKDRYDLGIRALFPRVQLGIGNNDTVLINAQDNSSHRLSLTVTQPLYDGGRTSLQRDLARTALLLESTTYARKQETILDGIFNLFYQILVLEEQKTLQLEIYQIALNQLAITEKEMAIGQIREIDLVETKLEVRSLELQLSSSRTGLEELYFEFNRAIGQEIKTPVSLVGSIDLGYAGTSLTAQAEYYFELAMQHNIDFRKNDFELKKSIAELKMAEKNYLPSISAETTFNLSGSRYPLQDFGATLKLNLSFPLAMFPLSTSLTAGIKEAEYSRGINSNVGILEDLTYPLNKKQAVANLQMMKYRETELKETFLFQIEKFLAQYEQKKANLSLRRELLLLQKKKIEILEKQFAVGEIKRLDLLKSRSSLFKEEIDLLQQVLELINFERSFETLLGIEAGTLATLSEGG